MDCSPTCITAHRQWSPGALPSYPVIKSSIDSKQVTDLFFFFFLTTCNFAVVCTFSPRHIGYHLLFITKNVLTTKSHIPDTQKREDIATIFWARGAVPWETRCIIPQGCKAHPTWSTCIYHYTADGSEASKTPVLFYSYCSILIYYFQLSEDN